jgi:hypothetical protein
LRSLPRPATFALPEIIRSILKVMSYTTKTLRTNICAISATTLSIHIRHRTKNSHTRKTWGRAQLPKVKGANPACARFFSVQRGRIGCIPLLPLQ